ncbi:hypothetical protein M2262_003158 [Pseudomonas sp. BIGb0408]|uniref:Uncharacterized protein n=1 Tax=Phytopseudomonas flavescens TaxID=29435 RepID=A0A7Z0BMC3_9GAMM|nr:MULTISPECIES: hypothetical protein [Pseudomonas]MCW2293108.1 hypothetical protein [Pseudomonas sp. BIGb0408]NYH72322.1 hypothetical protein [Pseudomonas flavescens]
MTAFNREIPNEITEIISKEGMPVDCRYLSSPAYDPESNLCKCLHWLFVLYGPSKSYSNSYLLRSAIEHFLTFLVQYNSSMPEQLKVEKYTDITSEVFTKFIHYLRDRELSPSLAEKLKTAITVVARDTGKLPFITLPMVPINKKHGQEPLSPEGVDSLQSALTTHIHTLWDKLRFRAEVDEAQPYIASEVMELFYPPVTRQRALEFVKYNKQHSRTPQPSGFITQLSCCNDTEIQEVINSANPWSELCAIYENCKDSIPYEVKSNPLVGLHVDKWEIDYARVMKTFLVNGYPFSYDLRYIYDNYRRIKLGKPEKGCDDIIAILLYRLTTANRKPNLILFLDEVLALYYPTIVDMLAIVIFMMFQSGWNKETALAIDQNNFEHPLTSTIESAIRVVFSEKSRSQGNDKTYHDAKRINLPTRDDDPYSFYNLIRLAIKMSEPLDGIPFDVIPILRTEDRMNTMFLCIRPSCDWDRGGRHTSIAHPKTFRVAMKHFLQQYEVIEDGKRLASAKEITRRLRPTWLLYTKKHNPIALLSTSMGHSDRETTDIFYDNSGLAVKGRLQRLRTELEEIMTLLRTRQFKGMIGAQAQADATADLKIFHIPGLSRPMWACADQRKPDWVGSEIIARTGGKCWELGECIFCSQLRIFEDSLPFLMERASHLEEMLGDDDAGGFANRIEKELEAIRFILDEWGDEEDISMAARYRRRNSPLLPRDLKVLKVIFESEDHNV